MTIRILCPGLPMDSGPLTISHTGSFQAGIASPKHLLMALGKLVQERKIKPGEIRLNFAGDWRASDQALADEQQITESIAAHGYIDHDACVQMWIASHVLLIVWARLDSEDRFPSKFWEYIGAERFIFALAPPEGKMARMIREENLGLVAPPDDPAAIAAALLEIAARHRQGTLRPQPSAGFLARMDRSKGEGQVAAILARAAGGVNESNANAQQGIPASSVAIRLPIPFLTTTLFGSILLAFAAVPVWYITGLDQFIWPFLFVFLGLRLAINFTTLGKKIAITGVASLGLSMLGVQLLSALFIIEPEFYIVFARNFSIWLGGMMLIILLTNVLKTRSQLIKLFWVWVFVIFLADLAGILAFFLGDGFEFRTLILQIVPEGMRTGVTAETVWTRSFLAESVPISGFTWYRSRSFFLYANTFAGVLVVVIPAIVYLTRIHRKFSLRWWFLQLVLVLSVFSVLITTSRGAILGLTIGLGVIIIWKTRPHDRLLWIGFIALAIALILTFFIYNSNSILEPIEAFTTAKGKSHVTRFNILKYSLISWAERPVFGWGTPRDMAIYGFGPAYPRLGSHSQFLAMLYRHGIVGLGFYLLFLLYIFASFAKVPKGDWRDRYKPFLLWAVLANLIQSIFTQIDVDVMMLFFVCATWGVLTALPRMATDIRNAKIASTT